MEMRQELKIWVEVGQLTSLVFLEVYGLRVFGFIRVDFCIESVHLFECDCDRARARIDGAPPRSCIGCIMLQCDIFDVDLSKTLDCFALQIR